MTNEKIKTKESSIDLMMTGQVMKREIKKKGYTVRELQKKLGLSCPQPIYRWLQGRTLPSIPRRRRFLPPAGRRILSG